MTLDNLQYALYLNNRVILNRIKNLKDAIDDIVNTDIDELKKLIEDINNTDLANINQLITDLDTDLSNHVNDTVVHVTQDDKDLWNATLQNAKDYAKKLFDGVTSFTIEIVDTLPTEDIKSMTIYFIRNEHDNEFDYYDEYMYINDKWEIIGSTFVNLAPYLLKEDFEKYQQEIADKFAKYNTSDEITNILKDYLLTQTFNNTIKNYTTTEALQKILEEYSKTEDIHTHENKDVIDKLSESEDGTLLFDGQEIKSGVSDITISEEENNAIQQKEDGIFVENKTEQINNIQTRINQISIAQKTSLEKSYIEDVLYDEIINLTGIFELLNNIQNYDEIIIEHGYGLTDARQFKIFKVSELEYNSDVVYHVSHGNGSANSYINFKFINNLSIQITHCVGSECIFKIIGIRYNQITIDPVEYINNSQGIEDTPVGHIISHMGNNAPKHYLICDGTEYNIIDYPYLAQHFIDEFGSVNYFGGDGINTFAIPDLTSKFEYSNFDINMDSNISPEPYIVNASSEYSTTYSAYKAFDNVVSTFWSSTKNTNEYIIFDFGSNEHSFISAIQLRSRSDGATGMIKDFTIEGSNDNINYDVLLTLTNETNWSSGELRTYYFEKTKYRYYKINILSNNGRVRIDISEIKFLYRSSVLCIKYEPTYYMSVGQYTVQGFEDYSEEEKIVGRYVNGKPIYRKTLIKTALSITPVQSTNRYVSYLGLDLSDAEYIVSCSGDIVYRENDTTNYKILIGSTLMSPDKSVQRSAFVLNNVINFVSQYSRDRFYGCNITVEYTKTTDEENSFTSDMLSTIVISENKQEEDLTEEELSDLIADTINLLNE